MTKPPTPQGGVLLVLLFPLVFSPQNGSVATFKAEKNDCQEHYIVKISCKTFVKSFIHRACERGKPHKMLNIEGGKPHKMLKQQKKNTHLFIVCKMFCIFASK